MDNNKTANRKNLDKRPADRNFQNKSESFRHDFKKDKENARNNKYSHKTTDEASENSGLIIGRNAVRELLKTEREIDKILVQRGEREGSIVMLVAMAVERGIPVVETDKAKLDAMSGFVPHQGIVAMASEKEYCSVEDILAIAEQRGEPAMIVVADGITDPYNLGALIRCAEGAGAHGIIIPKRRSTGVTPLVAKSSAGAIEHMAIAKVSNIASTLRELKEKGIWTFAAEAGGTPYYETNFKGPCALVFGSEGDGVSKVVIDTCDFLTSIPMYGKVNSFNVSTAASVILCEAAKQNKN
ncbi:MAG: 23S rRNA (guanosine(2251)-2'-O)-methyltransferase RlmB [Ruminococcaceae bacterium]|nr:23S rRNA (guanosine(2251)-2'-O)-methyltransferase RlmB [Oscillospiraceae bacterium]